MFTSRVKDLAHSFVEDATRFRRRSDRITPKSSTATVNLVRPLLMVILLRVIAVFLPYDLAVCGGLCNVPLRVVISVCERKMIQFLSPVKGVPTRSNACCAPRLSLTWINRAPCHTHHEPRERLPRRGWRRPDEAGPPLWNFSRSSCRHASCSTLSHSRPAVPDSCTHRSNWSNNNYCTTRRPCKPRRSCRRSSHCRRRAEIRAVVI